MNSEPITENYLKQTAYHTACFVKFERDDWLSYTAYCMDHKEQICNQCLRDLPCKKHESYEN